MKETILLVMLLAMYIMGFISGKAIYKSESENLKKDVLKYKRWWMDLWDERAKFVTFKENVEDAVTGTGTVQMKLQKIKDLVSDWNPQTKSSK